MNAKEIAIAVDTLLSDESKWTKHAWAKNKDGDLVSWDSEFAICYCLGGAVRKVVPNFPLAIEFISLLEVKLDVSRISYFNDDTSTTFGEVKKILKEFIDSPTV